MLRGESKRAILSSKGEEKRNVEKESMEGNGEGGYDKSRELTKGREGREGGKAGRSMQGKT